ncbi:MAG: SAM-dependent chlorinase/fluorinase [Frankiaceae bacterium]|nr:SAM-dependent chlorinase/fluorinase [Frankiaceae bacterium]MBV9869811.1 SAM-dependent chlorinase/fluorinase [Frankiaceae bacterium]
MSESKQRRYDWVTFTSDYGLDDVFVGVCKGVVAQLAPHVRILDVCHLIAAQDVEQGANSLAAAIPYLPVAVHLALVDPMHGSSARGIAVETTDSSMLVGPDNGLLSLAWNERGGVARACEITNPKLWRETVHKTFRGRDVFAPVAAHLANGGDFFDIGPAIPADSLTRIPVRSVVVDDDHVHAEVSLVDHFGNVSLNLARSDLEAAGISFGDTVELRCNGRTLAVPFTATYGDVPRGRLTLCEDSFRAVMLAVNAGHASQELRITRGEPVVIARLPQQASR